MSCLAVMESESEVAQSCPVLCDSVDYSPPGFSIHGVFQARILEWGAIMETPLFPAAAWASAPYFPVLRELMSEVRWATPSGPGVQGSLSRASSALHRPHPYPKGTCSDAPLHETGQGLLRCVCNYPVLSPEEPQPAA